MTRLKSHEGRNVFLDPEHVAAMAQSGAWKGRVITDYFDHWADADPDRIACVSYRADSGDRRDMTRGALRDMSLALAADMQARGVMPGDIVAFQLQNRHEALALVLACVRIGAVVNPLMPVLRARELTHTLTLTGARLLFVPETGTGFDFEALALEMKDKIATLDHVITLGADGFNGVDPDARPTGAVASNPDDLFEVMFTSGTTGEPKGVMHTANTMFANVEVFAERFEAVEGDVIFCPTPIAHQLGFLFGILLPCVCGASVVYLDAWKPAIATDICETEKVSVCMGATPFLADLAGYPDIESRDLDAFRLFISGGAPIPPALVSRAVQRLNARVASIWGMTEVLVVTAVKLDDPDEKVSGTDGVATRHMAVRVVDAEGNPAPVGTEGRLEAKGAAICVGYLKRPDLYGMRDGWFDTGDLGRMDADGYIRITGRTKDLVIRGGENIPVVEIEALLFKHPAIAAVSIVGMPDERLSERACAFVQLKPGTCLTLGEVQAFLAGEGTSKSYFPERLEIIDDMPMTATGKIQKFVLRDRARDLRVS